MNKAFVLFLLTSFSSFAAEQELGLTLGRISGPVRSSSPGEIRLDGGVALQANYGIRLLRLSPRFSLLGQVHFLANGQRVISSANPVVTKDIATAYVTPGIRLRMNGKISPFADIGVGYALYEQSFFQQNGASNGAPRFIHRGALSYGGGVDAPLWRWIGLRVEVRDFYTGNPAFNAPVRNSGQHNVVFGGGFLVKFGR